MEIKIELPLKEDGNRGQEKSSSSLSVENKHKGVHSHIKSKLGKQEVACINGLNSNYSQNRLAFTHFCTLIYVSASTLWGINTKFT